MTATTLDFPEAFRLAHHWRDQSERVRLRVTGPDRIRLLHNLTTNNIKALPPGGSCEAFVTSLQGKTLGFIQVHATHDALWLRSDAGTAASLLSHFQKYGALDDVEFHDESENTGELHVASSDAAWLAQAAAIAGPDCVIAPIEDSPLGLQGRTFVCNRTQFERLHDAVIRIATDRPSRELSAAEWDALRIEAGTPVFGCDITEANLPQEIARDAQAISFQKGCYLGQETVARLDALGHVNKILRRVRGTVAGNLVAGTPLDSEGKPAGVITSAANSLLTRLPVGLAMVRTAHAAPGTRLNAGALAVEIERIT